MQKRSPSLGIDVAPIQLNSALPIRGGAPFEQTDHPIIALHIHQCLELGYCYSGSGIFVVGEKILPFKAGDVSFINHTEAHLAQSAPGTNSHWTWIYLDPMQLVALPGVDANWLDTTQLAGPHFSNILSPEHFPAIAHIVTRLIDELGHMGALGSTLVLRALVLELLILMQRHAPEPATTPEPRRLDYERIAPALAYMAQNYAQPADIQQIAKRCGLSYPHFRRLFRRSIGRSPLTYWHDMRLRMAASLLRTTSRSVLEISHEVGFETLSSFNRLFRSKFDSTPRAWREEVSAT
ncbi:MAG: helix-turn-helix domain-containing protein [Chthoniobacteraceae bacterium]